MGLRSMRNTEAYPELQFGCTYLLPVPAVECAWGARGTWQNGELNLYWTQAFGSDADKDKLLAWLRKNEHKFPDIIKRYRRSIDATPQIVYQDAFGVLFADGNGSSSYVYMAAMLWEMLPPLPYVEFLGENLRVLSEEE